VARIRTIKPEFWQDEKLAPLEPIHRLVFLGLISQADDAGRLVDNVRLIDGLLFPNTDHSSRESIEILSRIGRIIRYTSDSGQALMQITNWELHQKVVNPSKYTLPAPMPEDYESQEDTGASIEPIESLNTSSIDPKLSTNDQRPTTNDHGSKEKPRGGAVDNSPKQTDEFKDWCAFLEKLTGSGQCWNSKYKPTWDFYLGEIPLERMMEVARAVHDRKRFKNIEYLIRPYRDPDGQEHVGILERLRLAVTEERYQAFKRELAEEADRTRGEVTLFGESWNAEKELQRIQMRHGERSPEAREFARKWGIPLEVPA